jgi:hypothetical protein
MSPLLEIPINTMLADLDAALRRMLKAELGRHGFGGVNVVFDAPTRDWAATVSGPTVNLFLYDLREATRERVMEWHSRELSNGSRELGPPLMLQPSYAVTAWTRAVEDEHRLLSQVIGILYAHPVLPAAILTGTLAEQSAHDPPKTALAGAGDERRPDFWTAIGGEYKPSVDYSVVLKFPSGRAVERGPEVRTRVLATSMYGAVVEERHTGHGRVVGDAGEPVPDCWITLPELGRSAVTRADGRFTVDGLQAGAHRALARAADGAGAAFELRLPGAGAEVLLASPRTRA